MKAIRFLFQLSMILVLVAGLWAVTPAVKTVSADTITVCASGCRFTTIQAAVNAASEGDEILVGPGTYQENITIDKNIKLLSTSGSASTTIEGISGIGSLGTITINNNTTGVQIGDINQGFKIIGIDNGNPRIENAAIYFQGNHSNAIVRGNEIVANGDAGLMTEYSAVISGFVIESNTFTGKTFIGNNPAGDGFTQQFELPNVPRQLVVIGGGASGTSATLITFRNNIINGIAGGTNSSGQPQGNTLVTIDADNSIIQGNTFEGVTSRFATSLRARRPNTIIQNNTFKSTGLLVPTTGHLYLQNNPIDDTLISNNSFDKGVYVESATGGTVGISINAAVGVALPGSVIRVLPGIYQEQILIEKNLTILGEGDTTVIQSPAVLVSQFLTSTTTPNKPIITVKNANATLKDFKVDGLGRGNSNYRFMGVAFYNAGGTVENLTITGIRETPFSGTQHGVGLYAINQDGQSRHITVKNSSVKDFQKNGITLVGEGLEVSVENNTVQGKGPTNITAQNGIQISSQVNGTVQENIVEGVAYIGATWTASGILAIDVGDVTIDDNQVNNSQTSIYLYGGSATITNNRIATSKAAIGGGNYLTGIAAADPPFLPPAPIDTHLSLDESIVGNSTDEISVMESGDVVVIQNNIVNGGGDDPASVGIGAWAGETDEDVSFTILGNDVYGWGYGLDISKCVSGCKAGKFTSITLKENKIHQNIVGMYTNVEVDASLNWWGTISWYGYNTVTGVKDLFVVDGDASVMWAPWRDETLALSLDVPTITYADDDNAGKAEGEPGANGGTFGYDAFATIQDALNHVAAGGTVYVGAGNYSGDIQINKAVTITGQNRPVLDGRFWVNANHVTIQGFEIRNGLASTGVDQSAIYISGAQNVTIRDNHLIGAWTGGATNYTGGRGILTSGNVNNLLVDGNIVEKWVSGLYLNPTTGQITVTNNEIRDNWAGAGTDGQTNVTFRNNYFIGNIEGIGASAVGASFVVEKNAFINNTTAMKHYGGGNTVKAERNWWGHQSGPTITSNPGGSGQPVVGDVDFAPWLCEGTDSQPDVIGFQPAEGAAACTATSEAKRLVFIAYPTGGFEGLPFAVQPVVRAEDNEGNLAVNFNGAVILYLANNPAGGALQGSLLTNAVNGVATFSGVSINKAGENYQLAAIATSLDPAVGGFFNVLPQNADLAVSITATPNPVETGAALIYTVGVQNLGPLPASNLTLTVNLPAGVTFVNAGGTGWTCSQSGGVVTCTRFSLAAASSAPNVTISVNAPNQAGSITATASVNATTLDLVSGNNQASVDTLVVTIPETGGVTIYLPLVKK